MAEYLLGMFISPELSNLQQVQSDLKQIGKNLLTSQPPWCGNKSVLFRREVLENRESRLHTNVFEIDNEVYFGVFVLNAVFIESIKTAELPKWLNKLKKAKNRLLNQLRWAFIARFEPVQEAKVQSELDTCRFTVEQQEFIWRWIRKEINLIGKLPKLNSN